MLEPERQRYGHVILDEAQDLTPMQLRMVGRRVSGNSVTVLGDLAQATGLWSYRSWHEFAEHLGARRCRRGRGADACLPRPARDHGSCAARPRADGAQHHGSRSPIATAGHPPAMSKCHAPNARSTSNRSRPSGPRQRRHSRRSSPLPTDRTPSGRSSPCSIDFGDAERGEARNIGRAARHSTHPRVSNSTTSSSSSSAPIIREARRTGTS